MSFTTKNIDEELKHSDLYDIIIWMKENPNLIIKHEDTIMNKLSTIPEETKLQKYTLKWFQILVRVLYIDSSIYTGLAFRLIKAYVNSMNKVYQQAQQDIAFKDNEWPYNFLYIVISKLDDVKRMKPSDEIKSYLNIITMQIMNMYIPDSDPYVISTSLFDKLDYQEMLDNLGDLTWLASKYEEHQMYRFLSFKRLSLVFMHLSDLFLDPITANSFMCDYHDYIHDIEAKKEAFHMICHRYRKYFKENSDGIVIDIKYLLSRNETLKDDLVKYVCTTPYPEFSQVNLQIIASAAREICNMMYGDISRAEILIKELTQVFMECKNGTIASNLVNDTFIENMPATEGYHKSSVAMSESSRKIYSSYKKYKQNEDIIDSRLSKAASGMQKVLIGDVRTEIIEGKSYSPVSLLKKALGTAALFSFGPIKGLIAIVVRYALKKSVTESERKKIIMELEEELELIDEKISDAKGDDNREAKYAMMRTRAELNNALKKIQLGLEADRHSIDTAKSLIKNKF